MNQKQIRAAVEAMLFAYAEPIGADKLAQALQLPTASVESALEALHERCQKEDSGLCLLHLNTHWQLATKTEFAECVRRVLDTRRSIPLGPAAMETLTVIAYNQPVSRAFIEQVRGVDSSSSVSGLLEKGLIEEAGRLDLPGRPVAFRTTDVFLRCFGCPVWRICPRCGARKVRRPNERPVECSRWYRYGAAVPLKRSGHPAAGGAGVGSAAHVLPFCADVQWAEGIFQVKTGALGITFPVFQYPKPEPTEESKRKKKPKKAKAAKKPAKEKKARRAAQKGKADPEHPVHHPARSRDADPGCVRRAAHHPHPGCALACAGRTPPPLPAATASCRRGCTRCWACWTAFSGCSSMSCASCRTLAAGSPPWRTGCPAG